MTAPRSADTRAGCEPVNAAPLPGAATAPRKTARQSPEFPGDRGLEHTQSMAGWGECAADWGSPSRATGEGLRQRSDGRTSGHTSAPQTARDKGLRSSNARPVLGVTYSTLARALRYSHVPCPLSQKGFCSHARALGGPSGVVLASWHPTQDRECSSRAGLANVRGRVEVVTVL